MKVLFVAPRICTPWTEGRKKFVLDLISQVENQWQLSGLVTIDAGEVTSVPDHFRVIEVAASKEHIFTLKNALPLAIEAHKPDMLCFFPFGVFEGLRGLANLWLIRSVERICAKNNLPCCTLMYSLTAEARGFFHRRLLKRVYFNQYTDSANSIRFGVKLPEFNLPATHSGSAKTLLFMSGEAGENMDRLAYVLDVRGLRLLLQSGKELAARGYQLIVAAPLLKNFDLLEALKSHTNNTWPRENISFQQEVRFPDIYLKAGVFVFPYAQEEMQFIPTSIVEAMYFGIPVLLPRLKFLRQFYEGQPKAMVYEPGSVSSLIDQIDSLQKNEQNMPDIRLKARHFIDHEYDIANTAVDIERAYRELKS
tara:strand:- start:131 stop:1225 length:1095 start_codon:yes stop_codon:yes gene_type:complete